VRDDIGKDDSLVATDDSGQIAQFCFAELLRAAKAPIVGKISIPIKPRIKAGQLCHIHFAKQAYGSLPGTYRIDSDMRIIEAQHNMPSLTFLTLTDDLINSRAVNPTDAYKKLLEATAPGFQDRTRSSIYGGKIDIDQDILGKNYAT